ncbi:HAD family hydrolase [Paenibacillus turpanensis]|uniref:HAD family hydrolase n=1 Tax=Paenibacillus turpanensis TaxID=2689078 RepID=UPI00140A0709|nr:HAD family hydrolase [Paenibacillus turpanensis]
MTEQVKQTTDKTWDWLQEIEAVLFDLDGTLYQDEQFYRKYIEYLLEGTEWAGEASHWQDEAERILSGAHPLRIGHFYSRAERLGLRHSQGAVQDAFSWEGDPGQSRLRHMAEHSLDEVQYLGDAWSVVGAIASHIGVPEPRRRDAFYRIREDMATDQETFARCRDAAEAVRSLRGHVHLTLMTNSPGPTAIPFVERLGLADAFDQVVYGGGKPHGADQYAAALSAAAGISPQRILTIGDHSWNDLYPIKQLGGRCVWVSPYESADETPWDARLRSLEDLTQFLTLLKQYRTAERR